MFFPGDIWGVVKTYLLYDREEAIRLIKYNAELPYMLSLHTYKGAYSNMIFLRRVYPWIFRTLHIDTIRSIIIETEIGAKRSCN